MYLQNDIDNLRSRVLLGKMAKCMSHTDAYMLRNTPSRMNTSVTPNRVRQPAPLCMH